MASGQRKSSKGVSAPQSAETPRGQARRPQPATGVSARTLWSAVFWLLLLAGVYVAATRLDAGKVARLREAVQRAPLAAPMSIRPDVPIRSVGPAERPASAAAADVLAASPEPRREVADLVPTPPSAPLLLDAVKTPASDPAALAPSARSTPPSDVIYKCVEGGRVSFSQGVPCAGKAQRVELTPTPARSDAASTPS